MQNVTTICIDSRQEKQKSILLNRFEVYICVLNGIEMVAMFCAFGFRSKLQSKTKLPNILLHTIIDKKELIMRKKKKKKRNTEKGTQT